MESKAHFLKKIEKRSKSHHQLNISKLPNNIMKQLQHQATCISLKKQDIKDFSILGIVDKKVIISFNNRLKLFGYFDLHAVHERIRYEYYCWKLKAEEWTTSELCSINQCIVEKGNKLPHNAYGPIKKCLIRVEKLKDGQFGWNTNKLTLWGICLQTNLAHEVYVTSYRPIFGREFTQLEIIQIVKEMLASIKGLIPRLIDEWIGEFGCKSAYKFNDNLKLEEAKLLIANLGKCSFPWHCVHGRTTIHVKYWPSPGI